VKSEMNLEVLPT